MEGITATRPSAAPPGLNHGAIPNLSSSPLPATHTSNGNVSGSPRAQHAFMPPPAAIPSTTKDESLRRLLEPLTSQLSAIERRLGRLEQPLNENGLTARETGPSIPTQRTPTGGHASPLFFNNSERSAASLSSPSPVAVDFTPPFPPNGAASSDTSRNRQHMLSALGQGEDLIIRLLDENHRLRRRLDIALAEIHRLRAEAATQSTSKRRKLRDGDTPTTGPEHYLEAESSSDEADATGERVRSQTTAQSSGDASQSSNSMMLDVRHTAPVNYPAGYEPRKRRFSVSSESYHPELFVDQTVRAVPQKTEDQIQRLVATVKENVLFKHLESARILDVVNAMWEVSYGPGTVVIRQGDDGDNMYVIENGELDVLYSGEIVGTLGPGRAFGETALMYNCPRTATIRSQSFVKLWAIDRETFRRIIMKESIKRRALYQDFLAKVPLLENLLDYERAKVADALEPVLFRDGDVIIRQGSMDLDGFYIVEDGCVSCTKEPDPLPNGGSVPGAAVEAIRLGPGDYFGELALLTNKPRAATVTAVGPTRCLRITRKHFDQVMGPCEQLLKRNTETYASYDVLTKGGKQVRAMSRDQSLSEDDDSRRGSNKNADRQEILARAVASEEAYVSALGRTVHGYLAGMVQHSELKVSQHDISIIFANVEELYNIHVGFLEALKKTSSDSSKLLPVMRELVSKLSSYLPFIQCYYCSIFVRKKRRSVPSFNHFLKSVRGDGRDDLDALLDQPFRRVNHYAQLILDLVQTASQEDSKESFQHLIHEIKVILASLEEARVRAEQVYAILQNITGEVEFVQNPSRIFLYEGRLSINNSQNTTPLYGFLFNDILVLATQFDAGTGKPKLAHFNTLPLGYCAYRTSPNYFTLEWEKGDGGTKDSLSFAHDQTWETALLQAIEGMRAGASE